MFYLLYKIENIKISIEFKNNNKYLIYFIFVFKYYQSSLLQLIRKNKSNSCLIYELIFYNLIIINLFEFIINKKKLSI